MSFNRSQIGTRGKFNVARPAWMVEHTKTTVSRAPSTDTLSSVPSYALGSTSNPSNINNFKVTRHHAVSLSEHHPRRVNMAHNGPILSHKSIPSPRHKSRHRAAPDETFSLGQQDSANTATASTETKGAPTVPSSAVASMGCKPRRHNVGPSAEQRADKLRKEMARKAQQKEQRAVAFQIALKKRLSKRVKKERQQANQQREAWVSLEQKSKQNASDWAATEANGENDGSNNAIEATTHNRSTVGAPCTLLNHMLNVTAKRQQARSALSARSRKDRTMQSESMSGWHNGTVHATVPADPADADPADPVDPADPGSFPSSSMSTPSSTSSSPKWSPDLSMNNGTIDSTDLDRQSHAHLVQSVRKAEALAQRKHAKQYRENVQRKARLARREAEINKQRALQNSRVAEARIANEQARDEYELFL